MEKENLYYFKLGVLNMSKHKINGEKWKVKFTTKGLSREHYGMTYYNDRDILIEPNDNKWLQINTVIHETLHASCPQLNELTIKNTADTIEEILRKHKKRLKI